MHKELSLGMESSPGIFVKYLLPFTINVFHDAAVVVHTGGLWNIAESAFIILYLVGPRICSRELPFNQFIINQAPPFMETTTGNFLVFVSAWLPYLLMLLAADLNLTHVQLQTACGTAQRLVLVR